MPDEDAGTALARSVLHPIAQAALTLKDYEGATFDDLSLHGLVAELSAQAEAVTGGDLKRAEVMLIAQAHSLDAIFNYLARRAALNAGQHLGACETYLRVALRAQSQCRTTLETLAVIKNPVPATFVRQQNIGVNQQVNNGAITSTDCLRADETEIEQSKLSGGRDELSSYAEASPPAGSADSQMATVGKVDRAQDNAR